MMKRRKLVASVALALIVDAAGWNIGVPGIVINRGDVNSAESIARMAPIFGSSTTTVVTQRYARSQLVPRVWWLESRQPCRLPASVSETMEHEPTPGNDLPNSEEAGDEPRPFPKVGDVVRYQGKWADEICFGEIRQIQRVDQTGEWRAYVLDLEEIGNGQYARRRNRRSKAEDISTLRPVRAFYVRSVDGFKVIRDSDTNEPRYISDGYQLKGFELPKLEVDPAKFAADLESYEDLKRRLVLDTASFGVVGALVTFGVFGADRGVMFALGALAAVGYLIILENAADNIASGKQDTIAKLQDNARFAMPVLAVGTVGLKNYISNPDTTNLLSIVPKDDFAAIMLGFVTPSRLPLLYREIRASLKGEEILDMLPGSIGQGRRLLKGMDEERVVAKAPDAPSSATKIVVVSGPRYLGKTTVVNGILAEDDRLAAPVWCTTRPLKSSEVDGQDIHVFKPFEFEDLQRKGNFVHTYEGQDRELYGLRVEDIKAVSEKGKVCVVDANMDLVKALKGSPNFEAIGVWVSLDSIEAIEDRISTALRKSGGVEGSPDLESEVRGLVRQAVDDIEFGDTRGEFDITVINDSDVEESMETMRRAVTFAT